MKLDVYPVIKSVILALVLFNNNAFLAQSAIICFNHRAYLNAQIFYQCKMLLQANV